MKAKLRAGAVLSFQEPFSTWRGLFCLFSVEIYGPARGSISLPNQRKCWRGRQKRMALGASRGPLLDQAGFTGDGRSQRLGC